MDAHANDESRAPASWRQWQAAGSVAQRVDYWKEVVCQAVLSVTMTPDRPATDRAFDGTILSRNQAGARLVNFHSSAHRITRTARQACHGDDQYLMVGLQCSGVSRLAQRQGEVTLKQGDIGILDASMPFDIVFPDSVDRRIVMLPRKLLAARMPMFRTLRQPQRLAADDAVTSIIAHTMSVLTSEQHALPDTRTHVLLGNMADLLALHFTEAAAVPGSDAGRHAYDHLRRYIDANLAQEGLTPAAAAASARISLRSAHRLFQRHSQPRTSIERYIVEQRLVLARHMLESGAAPSVSAAAFAAGFSDLSHFTKRFTERFGATPSSLQRRRTAT